jgi:hypothetical protein
MPRGGVAARSRLRLALLVVSSAALAGCVGEDPDSDTSALIVTGHCRVGGSGAVASGATFTGDVHDVGGTPAGSWNHTDSSGVLVGTPTSLVCRINGATLADVTGSGSWNGTAGYTYNLHVQDRGNASSPSRVPSAPVTETLVASRVYSPSEWNDGALSFADGALVAVPASLPVTEGNAGNQWARLTFVDHDTGEPTRCSYRGGASRANPTSAADIASGLSYEWARCETCAYDASGECVWETDPTIVIGTTLDVDSMELHVQHGSSRFPTCDDARTTVSLGITVHPFVITVPLPDYYRLSVFDPSGALVLFRDGDLTSGDLSIAQLP